MKVSMPSTWGDIPGNHKKQIRIAMVTPRYIPFSGGVENHVFQVASRLVHRGVSVTVLTTDPTRKLPSEEMCDGIQIQRVPAWPRRRDYYFAPGLDPIIRYGKWDIIHVQSYHTFVPFLAMNVARQSHIPYILTFHGGGHSSVLRHAVRPLQRMVLRPYLVGAAKLVALARFEIEEYGQELNLPLKHFTLIPNGADLPAVVNPVIASTGKLILSVGRLEEYKGHQRAIAALPYVLTHHPDVHLRIVGTGPYEPELQKLAHELGVTEKVEIGGIPPEKRQEMAELISRAALVVLLSDFETHPIAALEALSLKRPVLVADNSGMKELADRGWVRSVPTRATSSEIGRAILQQLSDPLISANLHLPTWDDCAQQLHSLYLEILNAKGEPK